MTETMNRVQIIDMHCHAAGIGAGGSGCFLSPAMGRNWRTRFYFRAFGVTEAELLTHGDELVLQKLSEGVARSSRMDAAVVLAMDGIMNSRGELDPDHTELYVPNEFLARQCHKHPNLLFGASVNPLRRDALERLDAVVANGAVLLKWLPSIQGIDPADRRLVPFYRRLAELGLPLLTHTGTEASFTRADNRLADPARLRLPLEEGVTVIAAHCGCYGSNEGEHNLTRILPLFDEFPNLYADISGLTVILRPGNLQRLMAHRELYDRFLYGSDMPLPETGVCSPWLQLFALGPAKVLGLTAIKNPWDRDVAMNLALGMPEQILARAASVLNLNNSTKKGS